MIVMRDTSNVHSQCSLGLLGRYFKLKLVIVWMFTLFGWARDAASATLPPWLVKTLERLSAEANFRTTGHSENVASPRRVCNKLLLITGHKFPNALLMVVLSPLNWLIKDQITSCERLGIKACKVEVENFFAWSMWLRYLVCKPRGIWKSIGGKTSHAVLWPYHRNCYWRVTLCCTVVSFLFFLL